MKRLLPYLALPIIFSSAAFGQSAEPAPRFEIADVHVSARTLNPYMRSGPPRVGRFEIKTATMVDLIRTAWGFDADKVLGGPNWLEMDRFDVIAKVPPDVTPETRKLMQQSLLQDRFRLVVHKETRPMPTYALTAGKKLQLREVDGTGDTGCRTQPAPAGAPGEGAGVIRMMSSNSNGGTTTISLGPGMTIQFACRNMTMAAFAEGLRGMMGVGALLGNNPLLDETGLKGSWNFDVKWSLQMNGGPENGDRITVSDALEKQLGLKLEPRQVPMPVLVVDSVNRKPADNPPGVAEALPAIPPPAEFEVAEVKLTSPDLKLGRFQIQPGGRLMVQGMAMRFLLSRAFNTFNNDQVVGAPKWTETERFDITAKAPSTGPSVQPMDMESVAPMLLALLVDRFKLTYHTEERQVSAYSLVAGKPKMKKADPASRTFCRNGNAPAGAAVGSRMLTCQNITMAQFADQLQNMAPGLSWPVLDATGIEGGWDFTLIFSQGMPVMAGPGRGADTGSLGGEVSLASDPSGRLTIFEAVEKQLGLRLETRKRSLPVIVIDHLEQKPAEN